MGKSIEDFLKSKGIEHQCTVPYSPEQNRVAEGKNRSLIEMAKCMLLDADLENKYWGEAIMTAIYLQNKLPTKATEKTPYEMWIGRKPDLSEISLWKQIILLCSKGKKIKMG